MDDSKSLPAWLADCEALLRELSPEQRNRVVQVIHSSYLSGAQPPFRKNVARLVDIELGRITVQEAIDEIFEKYGHTPASDEDPHP